MRVGRIVSCNAKASRQNGRIGLGQRYTHSSRSEPDLGCSSDLACTIRDQSSPGTRFTRLMKQVTSWSEQTRHLARLSKMSGRGRDAFGAERERERVEVGASWLGP